MDNKENFDFDFNEKYEDIISSIQKKQDTEYEDIVSDSSLKNGKHIYEDISSHSRKKRITGWKKGLLISGISVFLVLAIFMGWFFIYFDYNYNEITTDPNQLGFTDVKEEGIINIALFGVDSRDEVVFKGNTDSIMILSLNTNTKKVKIISIMRDTLVPMDYQGKNYYAKINSAYSKGPEHAIKTLNQNFDLDISEYATVNFFGMTDIINAVGGITATITKDELAWKGNDHPNLNNCMDEICREMGLNPKDYYIHTAGEQTLNGVQAVAYARVRHCTSVWGTRDDFGRTDRQRHVMQELFNKATKMGKTQYISLAKALIPCTETSLSYGDIIGLATNILLDSPSFEQYRLPPSEYQREFLMKGPSGYGSIIYYDLDYASELVNGIIYDDLTIEEYVELNPVERNDWYYEMTGTNGKNPSSNTSTPSTSTPSNNSTTSSEETDVTSSEEDVSSEEPTDNTSSDNTASDDVTSDDTSSDDTTSDDTDSEDVTGGDEPSDDTTSDDTANGDASSGEGTVDEDSETPTENENSSGKNPPKNPHRKK